MQILHLEDDTHDAELVHRALIRQGLKHEIHVVASRSEYLAALDAGSFAVILSDTGLPGFDGSKALGIAREKHPETPFIVVSGHLGNDNNINRLKLAGATDCVSKTNLDKLASAIQRAIEEKSSHTAPADGELRYTRAMEHLVTVVQELSLARDLQSVMTIVRHAARELTGADGATFVLRDGDLCYYADEDAIAPLWKGLRFPMPTCISGWAMLNRKQAVIEDIYSDPRIPHEAYRPTFVKSLAMVPIRTMDPIGAIGNYWAKRHQPSEEEVKLLQALADTTAVAMENVKVYAELEQRVKDRTVGLEAANKELEAFSYAVSHDLRTPLRHIDGFSQMLVEDCEGTLNDKGRQHLEHIRSVTVRMGQLIEDLLNLSRTTQTTVTREEIDLGQIARDIASALQAADPGRKAKFIIADGLTVRGDPHLLRVSLENLISNAWKFTSKKTMARIEVGEATASDGQAAYYVRDNGAGFDMAYSEKLFGVFQRLHSDKTFPGTGVGLATVQRVIHKHGGKIWGEAAVGKGATFYFTLG